VKELRKAEEMVDAMVIARAFLIVLLWVEPMVYLMADMLD